MYARVVTIKARPARIEECIRIFKEVNGPSIARQPGFDHGHWWADRDSGEAVSVTFWDTAEHEQASRANIPALITGMATYSPRPTSLSAPTSASTTSSRSDTEAHMQPGPGRDQPGPDASRSRSSTPRSGPGSRVISAARAAERSR